VGTREISLSLRQQYFLLKGNLQTRVITRQIIFILHVPYLHKHNWLANSIQRSRLSPRGRNPHLGVAQGGSVLIKKAKTKPTLENTGDRWPRNTPRQSCIDSTTQTKLGWADAEHVRHNTKPEFRNIIPKLNLTYSHGPMNDQSRRRISGRHDSQVAQLKT